MDCGHDGQGRHDRPVDFDRLLLTDSPAEAVEHILAVGINEFGLQQRRRRAASRVLETR
jgi:hypothetical protein